MRNLVRSVGFVALVAGVGLGGAAQAVPYTFTLIAETGAVSGSFGSFDRAPSLNNAGTAAFNANIHTLGTRGIWTGDGSAAPTQIVSDVDFAGLGGMTPINNSGQVGFFGTSNVSGVGGFWRNTGGLAGTNTNLFDSPSFGAIQGQPALNDSGVGAAYVQPAGFVNEGIYTSNGGVPTQIYSRPISTGLQHSPDINATGHVAFANKDANGNIGIFLYDGSTITQIMDVTGNGTGQQTGASADIHTPRLNDSDHVVFHGRQTDGTSGIFVEASGTVSTAALAGISGGEYGSFEETAAINNSDEVAFISALIGGGEGIYTGADPIADKVIKTGDSLLGGTVTGLGFGSFGLNDNGSLAFWATIDFGEFSRQVIVRADLVTEAPEPASLVLFGLGLSALGYIRRRSGN